MLSGVSSKFGSVVSDGWSWGWDGSTIEGQITRLVFTMLVAVLVIISCYTWSTHNLRKMGLPLPPGPRGLPLVGNLPFLESDLHRYFAKLTQTYGPIFKFKLGNKLYVVLSSPSLAKEALKDHDAIFAHRDDAPVAALGASYGELVTIDPNGSTFRVIRKLLIHDLLGSLNLEACYALRELEVHRTLRELYANIGKPVNIGDQMFLTIINMMISMFWGVSLEGDMRNSIGLEFRHLIAEIVELLGKPNVSDIFPVLAWFDFQGLQRQYKKAMACFDQIFDSIVDQKLKMGVGKGEKVTKNLLDLISDAKTSVTTMQLKNLFVELILASTDTTSTTLEWAIAEMMHNPKIMKNIQAELDGVVGIQNRVQGSYLSSLPYLDAVVKETLRLHPAAPLLYPHRSDESFSVGGYAIPAGSRVFYNVWALQRDPEAWNDPFAFKPERFLSGTQHDHDYRGNCFSYLPFGSGRRMCIGIFLAQKMLMFTLAAILHSFELSLPEGTKLDLSDTFGLVLKKKTPLVVTTPYWHFCNTLQNSITFEV